MAATSLKGISVATSHISKYWKQGPTSDISAEVQVVTSHKGICGATSHIYIHIGSRSLLLIGVRSELSLLDEFAELAETAL